MFSNTYTKPLSTATGERITSLGPARFMASMHIVAGHLYQKSALGPLHLLSWGYTWVPWFFMLSGYVLMHARLNSRKPNKLDHPLTSLWKRTSSIFPMYAIGVVLDMLCFCFRGTKLPDYQVLIAQSFLLQSWVSFSRRERCSLIVVPLSHGYLLAVLWPSLPLYSKSISEVYCADDVHSCITALAICCDSLLCAGRTGLLQGSPYRRSR